MVNLSDLVAFKNTADYNLRSKDITQSTYSFIYSPLNNCWKIEFDYARNQIDKKVGLIFYINYNENNFTQFNVK